MDNVISYHLVLNAVENNQVSPGEGELLEVVF